MNRKQYVWRSALWRLACLVAVLVCTAVAGSAQSRAPELKFKPLPPKEKSDTFNFEERPYFILIDESERALADNDYDRAALRLIEAMSVEPQNPLNVALMSNLGMIYYYNEQDSLALATLTEAVRRSPRLVGAREHRARVLTGMGRDREAYDEYAAILEIDSVNTDARFFHGMMALYGGDLPTAQADFAVLQGVVPLSRRTTLAMATMHAFTGNNREAISLFRKLIDVEKMPEYYAQLAGCLLAEDDLDSASRTIGEGLELFKDDPELIYYRAMLNHRRYMPEEAMRDARRAIELGVDPKKVMAIFDNVEKL